MNERIVTSRRGCFQEKRRSRELEEIAQRRKSQEVDDDRDVITETHAQTTLGVIASQEATPVEGNKLEIDFFYNVFVVLMFLENTLSIIESDPVATAASPPTVQPPSIQTTSCDVTSSSSEEEETEEEVDRRSILRRKKSEELLFSDGEDPFRGQSVLLFFLLF